MNTQTFIVSFFFCTINTFIKEEYNRKRNFNVNFNDILKKLRVKTQLNKAEQQGMFFVYNKVSFNIDILCNHKARKPFERIE